MYASLDNDVIFQENEQLLPIYTDYFNANPRVWSNGRKNGPGKRLAEAIEKAVKHGLHNQLNISTCAMARGQNINIQIDLSEVSDHLINLGNHNYNDGNGNFINPLIIPAQ
jgi:hypothetical protein